MARAAGSSTLESLVSRLPRVLMDTRSSPEESQSAAEAMKLALKVDWEMVIMSFAKSEEPTTMMREAREPCGRAGKAAAPSRLGIGLPA